MPSCWFGALFHLGAQLIVRVMATRLEMMRAHKTIMNIMVRMLTMTINTMIDDTALVMETTFAILAITLLVMMMAEFIVVVMLVMGFCSALS